MGPNRIDSFQGEHRFLSNFWPARVELDGVVYPSVEHAYVAAKTLNKIARKDVAGMSAGQAKRYGRTLKLRPDWDDVKLPTMRDLVQQKFGSPELARLLKATGRAELVEGNTWGDTYWGICRGKGENHLGRILMEVRQRLIES